jgi:Mn-dependent DtxR family transcriptional regulator
VIAGFVRGLPVRDVEAAHADALGAEAALSKSTVSRVCQAIGSAAQPFVKSHIPRSWPATEP